MNEINIFFVHKGYQPYLKVSIFLAKKRNPNASIFLLGDDLNNFLEKKLLIKHFNFIDFFNQANEFEKIYKHVSKNNFQYELFCFQRWFIIAEFVKQNNIKGLIFYNDSDTLLYCDFLELYNREYNEFEFSTCNIVGPQFTFFKNSLILDSFINYIKLTYTDFKKFEFIFNEYQNELRGRGSEIRLTFNSISDMSILGKFYLENKTKGVDLENHSPKKIFEENHYYGEKKYQRRFPLGNKIYWKNYTPYYLTHKNDFVQVLGFHLQGLSKREIPTIVKNLFEIVTFKEFSKFYFNYYNFLRSSFFRKFKHEIKNKFIKSIR